MVARKVLPKCSLASSRCAAASSNVIDAEGTPSWCPIWSAMLLRGTPPSAAA
jgi:hypothetical protein